jgi:hypothetical protein
LVNSYHLCFLVSSETFLGNSEPKASDRRKGLSLGLPMRSPGLSLMNSLVILVASTGTYYSWSTFRTGPCFPIIKVTVSYLCGLPKVSAVGGMSLASACFA